MAGVDEEKQSQSEQQEKMADEKPAEDEENQESSDEEPEPGLLDKPVMIFDQKRERKKVERFSMVSMPEKPKKETLDFSKGRGMKLGDIENVKNEIHHSLSVELKPLHKLLYGKDGKVSMIKKNIRAFCGFPFQTESKEYSNLQWSLEKFTNTGLQRLCQIFGMGQGGRRDELKEKVLKFLMEPYMKEKKISVTAKSESKKKRKNKGDSSDEKSKKKSKAAVSDDDGDDDDDDGDAEQSNVDDDDDDDDDDAREKHDNDENQDDDEETETKKENKSKSKQMEKKSASKPKKSKTTVIKLPTPSKKRRAEDKTKKTSTPKKSSPKKSAKKSRNSDSDDDDEDEPLVKKAKPEGPSDAMIEKIVRELLEGADLETVTMKMICKQVFNKFPGQDLTERKSFIKDTVKKVIS